VATEYLLYGFAEGGLADIEKVYIIACLIYLLIVLPWQVFVCKERHVTNWTSLSIMEQLDMLLQSLGFTQKKADSQVRWSVLNTVLLLRRHKLARAKLAEAMSMGKSVGSCLGIIEDTIDVSEI
jgi:hypothetical protein